MAVSSIFEKVKITDPKIAESFVAALESSAAAETHSSSNRISARMATPKDRERHCQMRRKKRTRNS